MDNLPFPPHPIYHVIPAQKDRQCHRVATQFLITYPGALCPLNRYFCGRLTAVAAILEMISVASARSRCDSRGKHSRLFCPHVNFRPHHSSSNTSSTRLKMYFRFMSEIIRRRNPCLRAAKSFAPGSSLRPSDCQQESAARRILPAWTHCRLCVTKSSQRAHPRSYRPSITRG